MRTLWTPRTGKYAIVSRRCSAIGVRWLKPIITEDDGLPGSLVTFLFLMVRGSWGDYRGLSWRLTTRIFSTALSSMEYRP